MYLCTFDLHEKNLSQFSPPVSLLDPFFQFDAGCLPALPLADYQGGTDSFGRTSRSFLVFLQTRPGNGLLFYVYSISTFVGTESIQSTLAEPGQPDLYLSSYSVLFPDNDRGDGYLLRMEDQTDI